MTDSHQTTVLVVEDESDLADTYALWLQESYDVKIAYNGTAALDQLDPSVDIALLDRRMPDLSGGEVLSTIRDRDIDCQVAMITAVEPDIDIAEMEFDAYLVKPISKDELDELVDRLLSRSQYDDRVQEFYALATKKAILDAELTKQERTASDEYAQLERRLTNVRNRTDEALESVFVRDEFPDLMDSLTNVDVERSDSQNLE